MIPFAASLFGSATSATPAFTPASLGTKLLAWYDPSDLSTLFQNVGASTAVTTAGDVVGSMLDKSGNGHTIATGANDTHRPTYQVDGSGHPYLLFDGSNDYLAAVSSFAITLPYDRISAIQQVSWTGGRWIFGQTSAGAQETLGQYTGGGSPQIRLFDGTVTDVVNGSLTIGTNGVLTERHISGASKLAVNNGAYVTGNAGTDNQSTLTVAGTTIGNNPCNMRLYGLIIGDGTLTTTDIANCRTWLGNKCGLSL